MGREYSERLVKPPGMDIVTSGRTFRPSPAFKKKYLFIAIVTAITIWALMFFTVYVSALFGSLISGGDAWPFLWSIFTLLSSWYLPIIIIVVVLGLLISNAYINSIEYSVVAESGEAMPEIYCRKGIVDVTEKHIPLRTITNVSSRAGVFDRLFGIGNVLIETAGSGGIQLGGVLAVDLKIEGIPFFRELRDHIVRGMRMLKGTYTTATEVISREDEFGDIKLQDGSQEILVDTLREILRVLRRLDDKLDRIR